MSRLPRLPDELYDVVTTSGNIAAPVASADWSRGREAVQDFCAAHRLTGKQLAAVVRAEVRLIAGGSRGACADGLRVSSRGRDPGGYIRPADAEEAA
jgi:hypothetical protein